MHVDAGHCKCAPLKRLEGGVVVPLRLNEVTPPVSHDRVERMYHSNGRILYDTR